MRLEDLERSVRVAPEDQVEETDASAPVPALKSPDELQRELMLRISAG